MKKRPPILVWLGVGFLSLLVVFAIFGPFIRHSPIDQVGAPFEPPSSEFWLGTDELGRDVFARLAQGARISLSIGFVVQSAALVLGLIMGLVGVLAPRWIGVPAMRFTDGMFAFPDILLAILLIGIWPNFNMTAVIIALSATAWPTIARLVKTQVASVKDREHVVAARAMGAGTIYLTIKHIMPHMWGILLAISMVDVASIILAESSLSFLGIGIQPPNPSWGMMIENGRANMTDNPQLLLWPCIVLSITIFMLNFVGDGLRELVDPRSR